MIGTSEARQTLALKGLQPFQAFAPKGANSGAGRAKRVKRLR